MKKLLYYVKVLCAVIQFSLLIAEAGRIISVYSEKIMVLIPMLVLDSVLLMLDAARLRFRDRNRSRMTVCSMLVGMLMMSIAGNDYIQVYYFFLLDYIMNSEHMKTQLTLLHCSGFFGIEAFRLLILEHKEPAPAFLAFLYIAMYYGAVLLIFEVIHYFKSEQQRLQLLNADIISYSFEERDYLIEKERSELSQELHDSLGHSLMAALFNVRYLKAIPESSREEQEKQLEEIEQLLKECTASLRSSVTNLRRLKDNICLKDEIERVIHKFNQLGIIHIQLEYDDRVSQAANEIKLAIFKNVREGITNSLQHGAADRISIAILWREKQIELTLRDNGMGCAKLHKSYGLNGMEERCRALGGEIEFISARNKGFTIAAILPGRMEHDTDHDRG